MDGSSRLKPTCYNPPYNMVLGLHADVRTTAFAIAGFLLHESTRAPTVIGLHGPWGKGKSTLMNLIEQSLKMEAALTRARIKRSGELYENVINAEVAPSLKRVEEMFEALGAGELDKLGKSRVLIVRFNAWKYLDVKEVWAGLAFEIGRAIEAELPSMQLFRRKFCYVWSGRWNDLILHVVAPILAALIVCLVITIFGPQLLHALAKTSEAAKIAGTWLIAFGVVGQVLFMFYMINSRVVQPVKGGVLQYLSDISSDHQSNLGYQDRVTRDLQFLMGFLHKKGAKKLEKEIRFGNAVSGEPALPKAGTGSAAVLNKEQVAQESASGREPAPRVVVMIDDLDRCHDDKVVEILQAVNLILGDSGFYTVLGMDMDMTVRAVYRHYNGTATSDNSNRLTQRQARLFLNKIVHVMVEMPSLSNASLEAFVGKLLDTSQDPLGVTARTTNVQPDKELELPNEPRPDTDTPRPKSPRNPVIEDSTPASSGPPVSSHHQAIAYGGFAPFESSEAEMDEIREFVKDGLLPKNPRDLIQLVNYHKLTKVILQWTQPELVGERWQQRLIWWVVFCWKMPHLLSLLTKVRPKVQ